MRIFVIRHGETAWNLKNKVQGRTDTPLSDNGIKQANEAQQTLGTYDIDVFYSSPLIRARDTADIIAEPHKKKVQIDQRLNSMDMGTIEGAYKNADVKKLLKQIWYYRREFGEGESFASVNTRVADFIEDIVKKHGDTSSIALVTHRPVIRMFYIIAGHDFDIIQPSGNCDILEFSYDGNQLQFHSVILS